MDLSIIIVSYNTRAVTCRCLATIGRHTTGLDYDVTVVDNGSSDGSAEAIEEEFPYVRVIRLGENRGFAAGQNIGLSSARGRYLLILNSDILFVENAAKALCERLDEDQGIGAAGPQILNPDGSVSPSARRASFSGAAIALSIINRYFHFKRLLPETLMRKYFGFLLTRWHDNYAAHDARRTAEYVDGMCVVVRREVLEKVGLFDEQFFFDSEILDLSQRIRAAGWRIEFNPAARVIHLGHSSRKGVRRIVLETHRSELIYFSRYDPGKVELIRRVTTIVVSMRLLLLKFMMGFGGKTDEREQTAELYRDILTLTRQFDPQSVQRNTRIGRLQSLGSF